MSKNLTDIFINKQITFLFFCLFAVSFTLLAQSDELYKKIVNDELKFKMILPEFSDIKDTALSLLYNRVDFFKGFEMHHKENTSLKISDNLLKDFTNRKFKLEEIPEIEIFNLNGTGEWNRVAMPSEISGLSFIKPTVGSQGSIWLSFDFLGLFERYINRMPKETKKEKSLREITTIIYPSD